MFTNGIIQKGTRFCITDMSSSVVPVPLPGPSSQPGPSWFMPVEPPTIAARSTSTPTRPVTPALEITHAPIGVLETTPAPTGVLKMRPRPASTSVLEKRPASMTEATEIVSTPVSVTTPIRTHGVTAVTAQRRKRRAPEADAEESALFQKWLASDIAKNEKKNQTDAVAGREDEVAD